jgi:hypothetical protein
MYICIDVLGGPKNLYLYLSIPNNKSKSVSVVRSVRPSPWFSSVSVAGICGFLCRDFSQVSGRPDQTRVVLITKLVFLVSYVVISRKVPGRDTFFSQRNRS